MPFSDGSQNWKAYSCTMRTNETAYAPKICPHGIAAALGAVRACLSYLCFGSVGMATIDVPPVLTPYALFSSNFHANLQLQNSLFWSMRSAGRNFTVSQGKKQPSLSDSAGQPPVLPRRVKQISRKGGAENCRIFGCFTGNICFRAFPVCNVQPAAFAEACNGCIQLQINCVFSAPANFRIDAEDRAEGFKALRQKCAQVVLFRVVCHNKLCDICVHCNSPFLTV